MLETLSGDYAYVLHRPAEVPAGFSLPSNEEPLTTGVYLPRSIPPISPESSISARLFLLFKSVLVVAESPDLSQSARRIPLSTNEFIESGRLLCARWFSIITAGSTYRFPYVACDQACVDVFLYDLRYRLMPVKADMGLVHGISCGAGLEVKFACAEADELDPEECILVRFFKPHVRTVHRHHWFFQRELWLPADYLGVTTRRILWLTDCHDGRTETGGVVTRYCSIARMSRVSIEHGEPGWELRVCFAAASPWRIPLAEGTIDAASSFIEVLRARAKRSDQRGDQCRGGAARKLA
jgi:hypothetical protein